MSACYSVSTRRRRNGSPLGFTLIELLVTVVIVSILATVAIPMAEMTVRRSKEQELRYALRQIRDALDAYRDAGDEGHIDRSPDASGYPANLQDLVEGVRDMQSPSGANIYFLRRIPGDPFGLPGVEADKTWGKRSYASGPEDPKEGDDVFDVYSLSDRIGLNGIPYRDW